MRKRKPKHRTDGLKRTHELWTLTIQWNGNVVGVFTTRRGKRKSHESRGRN